MDIPAGDILQAVTFPMPGGSISNLSFRHLEVLIRCLPSAWFRRFCLEFHLGPRGDRIDFSPCIQVDSGGHRVLAGSEPGLPEEWTKDKRWQCVREFAVGWEDETSVIHEKVREVWLEFDLPLQDVYPVPSIFVSTFGVTGYPHWIWDEMIPLLLDRVVPVKTLQTVEKCLVELPLGARLFQVGLMLGRERSEVRVCFEGLPTSTIPGYLKAIGWTGCMRAFSRCLELMENTTFDVAVDLDVGEKVAPKVGIECYHRDLDLDKKLEFWGVLDSLGLARQEPLVNAFGGYPQAWSWNASSGKRYFMLEGRISHHKMTFMGERVIEAKLYLFIDFSSVPLSLFATGNFVPDEA